MCQLLEKFHFRLVSAVRPSSVTDNLRGRYHAISGYDMLLIFVELAPLYLYISSWWTSTKSTKRKQFHINLNQLIDFVTVLRSYYILSTTIKSVTGTIEFDPHHTFWQSILKTFFVHIILRIYIESNVQKSTKSIYIHPCFSSFN